MPVTFEQLIVGANYQFKTVSAGDPIDNVNANRPLMDWFIKNREPSYYTNGIYADKVRLTNDGNAQDYHGDDELEFNSRDSVRHAEYQHYECFSGFTLNETEMTNNGIIITSDSQEAKMTEAEGRILVNKVKEGWATTKEDLIEHLDRRLHLDGVANPKAAPGLDALISTTPTLGTVAGLSAVVYDKWRNGADMGITYSNSEGLIDRLDRLWRRCAMYSKQGLPDFIPLGGDAYDAVKRAARAVNIVNTNLGSGGATLDPGTAMLRYNGVPCVHDYTFDRLDELLGPITYPWAKRGYFLNSRSLKLRPVKGRWMMTREPEKLPNRMSHFFGMVCDYGLTTNQRNNQAVFSIA